MTSYILRLGVGREMFVQHLPKFGQRVNAILYKLHMQILPILVVFK